MSDSKDAPATTHDASTYTRYLRHVQYATPDNLQARIRLHAKYATSPITFTQWFFSKIDWSRAAVILDVGCGPGTLWASPPRALEANLTLCDQSAAMVRAATATARGQVARVSGVVGSVQTLPIAENVVDVVIANYMLYHATDIDQAVGELRRVLRPDGLLVAATNGPAHLTELAQIERDVMPEATYRDHREIFGSISGRQYLERHFTEVRWQPFEDELHCRDVEDVFAYIRSMPPGDHATLTQQTSLRQEIETRMRQGHGVLRVTKDTGVFLARGPRAETR
ncbi:MAG TPA: methyltransferase domain-containing protein [Acidimicrobiales bacterium]|nr:methyltransferase domain-containing protein [Acidimicrobiales bacterium]